MNVFPILSFRFCIIFTNQIQNIILNLKCYSNFFSKYRDDLSVQVDDSDCNTCLKYIDMFLKLIQLIAQLKLLFYGQSFINIILHQVFLTLIYLYYAKLYPTLNLNELPSFLKRKPTKIIVFIHSYIYHYLVSIKEGQNT